MAATESSERCRSMIGRRAPGTSLAEAQAELTTLWTQLQRTQPELNQKLKVRLVPYSATAGGDSVVATQGDRMLAIFSVVTLLTIAIVCANVANLLIARAVVRQRELALRQSLGASRFRVIRGLLAEGLVLSAVAWCAACLFAWWVSRVVIRFITPPSREPLTLPDLTPDWTVVGYALALALLCTIAVTLGPALYTGRQQLLPFLKLGEQGVVQARSKLSRALVVLQLAFSVLLLTSAGLAYRSVSFEDGFNLGFDSGNILLATVNTAGSTHDPAGDDTLLETLRARLQRLPGVQTVSYVRGVRTSSWLSFPVRAERSVEPVLAARNFVGAGYFETVRVTFPAGHDFDALNTSARRAAIITQDLAETLWPGEPAVGKILIAGAPDRPLRAEVVGVVRNAYFGGRGSAIHPRYVFFSNHEQPGPPGETTFLVRHTHPRRLSRAASRRRFVRPTRVSQSRACGRSTITSRARSRRSGCSRDCCCSLPGHRCSSQASASTSGLVRGPTADTRIRAPHCAGSVARAADCIRPQRGFPLDGSRPRTWFRAERWRRSPAGARAFRCHTDGSTHICERLRVAQWRVAGRLLSAGPQGRSHGPGDRVEDGIEGNGKPDCPFPDVVPGISTA